MSDELSVDEKLEVINRYCSLKFPKDFKLLEFRFLEKYGVWLVCLKEISEKDLDRVLGGFIAEHRNTFPGKTKEDAFEFWERMMKEQGNTGLSWRIESMEEMRLFTEIAGKEEV